MTVLARLFFFAAMVALATPSFAQTDPVVAKVNGAEIRQSDLAAAEEDLGAQAAQLAQMPADAKREYLIGYVTDMMLVSKAAEAKKIGDTPEFKKKLALMRTKLLTESFLEQQAKAAATDAEMKKVYDEAIKQVTPEEEVSARHILIRADSSDEKAVKDAETKIKAVAERIKKGEDFAKVAGEVTEDPSGKTNGGDLGFFTKEHMVPEFADVAYKLDKGQVSDPVKTQFGWHIIKVDDKRKKPAPTFEQVKDQVASFVVRKAQAEMITKLRADAKVEKFDKDGKLIPAEAAKPAEPKK